MAAMLLFAPVANATLIEVETDGDEFGPGGSCALREAVEAARTNDAFGGCPAGGAKDTVKLVGDTVLTIDGDTATNADGDLDYDGGGKLTILGSKNPSPDLPKITQDFSDRVLEVTHQKGVRIEGVEIEGGGGVNAGGAVRAANAAAITLDHPSLHDNIATLRGGAVACEGCKSLKLTGAFQIDDNLAGTSSEVQGGAIWSNAPTKLAGTSGAPVFFGNALVTNNRADATAAGFTQGGAIYAGDDLTITDTYFSGNETEDNGFGGAVMLSNTSQGAKLKILDSTLESNTSAGAAGAIATNGTEAVLDVRRSAIIDNDTTGNQSNGSSFAGGLFLDEGGGKIVDSVVDGNTVTATAAGDTAAGGGIFTSTESEQPTTLRLDRTSVTNNAVAVGNVNQRGGGMVIQGRLEAVNATIANNTAPASGSDGGGLKLESSGGGQPSARLDFTTVKGNLGDNGDGIFTEGPLAYRASLIDQAADACVEAAPGLMDSKGYNVEEGGNAGCELDAPTDSGANDLSLSLGPNGSPPVGATGETAETVGFTANPSSLLDLVPKKKCTVDGQRLKVDARGVPRPAEDGCDTGAVERATCLGSFLSGTNALVGTKRADEIQGSNALADVVLAQAGDDTIGTYGGADSICAGKGDDLVQPQAGSDEMDGGKGTDTLNYNNAMAGGIEVSMQPGTANGPSIDADNFDGFENVQGSEDDDVIDGDGGANLIIGGGGSDEMRGSDGIDTIDAKDGEADDVIDCGPGSDAKEKAKYDHGLDPNPKHC